MCIFPSSILHDSHRTIFQTNLVERPSASVPDLSSQEMARSMPTLLVMRRRNMDVSNTRCDYTPMVVIVALVVRATKRCVTLKEEEIDNLTLRASVNLDARPAKAEPERTAWNATTDSARPGTEDGEYLRRHILAVQKAEEITDTGSFLPSSDSTTVRCSGAASRVSPKKAARSAFAYGLQPYKAVHDAANNVRDPRLRAHIIEIFV